MYSFVAYLEKLVVNGRFALERMAKTFAAFCHLEVRGVRGTPSRLERPIFDAVLGVKRQSSALPPSETSNRAPTMEHTNPFKESVFPWKGFHSSVEIGLIALRLLQEL